MKKLFAILSVVGLALNANAQDVYSVGCYNSTEGIIAALYKNNELLYNAQYANQSSKATRVACNSQGDVFGWSISMIIRVTIITIRKFASKIWCMHRLRTILTFKLLIYIASTTHYIILVFNTTRIP